jgi:CDP-alcohol phosphatidyltransferase
MSSLAPHLVIDARPRGPRGLLATEILLGRPVLSHLVEQAVAVGSACSPIAVHAREDELALLQGLMADHISNRIIVLPGPPRSGAAIMRTDRLYDLRRLRRAVRRGADPETAVIWRLDSARSLSSAEEELKRRLTYQPLGRFWAFSLAEKLAAALEPSGVRPNHLTLAAAALMLTAAAIVAGTGAGYTPSIATAASLAAALVLDTADGRLARLQGTSSVFGRWLDQVLDELADVALHAAIAWSVFQSSRQPYWLALGMLYLGGKYVFMIESVPGLDSEGQTKKEGTTEVKGVPSPGPDVERARPAPLPALLAAVAKAPRKVITAAGHADLRWHLWIALALFGRLDLALAVYAVYFPLRAIGGVVRKAVAHA